MFTNTQTSMLPEMGAQCAFKNLMIHEVLQFASRIAFRCVLHQCGSLDIHCRKLYCFLRCSWPQMKKATNIFLLSFQKYKTGSNEEHFPSLLASNKVHHYFLVCYSFLCYPVEIKNSSHSELCFSLRPFCFHLLCYPVQIKNSTHSALCCLFFCDQFASLLLPFFAPNTQFPRLPHSTKLHLFFIFIRDQICS